MVANLDRLDVLQTGAGLDRLISPLFRYLEQCWLEAEGEGYLAWGKGMEYIVGMPLRRWKEVREEVLSRAGRYHKVKDNLGGKGG